MQLCLVWLLLNRDPLDALVMQAQRWHSRGSLQLQYLDQTEGVHPIDAGTTALIKGLVLKHPAPCSGCYQLVYDCMQVMQMSMTCCSAGQAAPGPE